MYVCRTPVCIFSWLCPKSYRVTTSSHCSEWDTSFKWLQKPSPPSLFLFLQALRALGEQKRIGKREQRRLITDILKHAGANELSPVEVSKCCSVLQGKYFFVSKGLGVALIPTCRRGYLPFDKFRCAIIYSPVLQKVRDGVLSGWGAGGAVPNVDRYNYLGRGEMWKLYSGIASCFGYVYTFRISDVDARGKRVSSLLQYSRTSSAGTATGAVRLTWGRYNGQTALHVLVLSSGGSQLDIVELRCVRPRKRQTAR